jgi:hypothetical protein
VSRSSESELLARVSEGKRKRPPLLDVAAICSWLPQAAAAGGAPASAPPSPSLRRVSCPTAALPAPQDRCVKRARRPAGLSVRWRRGVAAAQVNAACAQGLSHHVR